MVDVELPKGWSIQPLKNLCQIVMGQSPLSSTYNASHIGIPLIQGLADTADGLTTPKVWTSEPTKVVPASTTLMSVRAPVGAVVRSDTEVNLGRGMCGFLPHSIEIGNFLYHSLVFSEQAWSSTSQGSTFTAVNKANVEEFVIALPDEPREQQMIAEALSDIDELISITKNAISKTENTKQSILYPLLTGKNSKSNVANWQQQPLGEILEYEQPTKYLVNTNEHKDSGKYPVLTAGKTFILGYTDDEYGVYAKEEVILFDDFTTEKKYVDFPFKVKSSACKMLTSRTDAINLRFVFEAMKLLKFQPYDHKRYWISEYSKLVLPLPEKNEQDSIAEVIKDFDLKLSLLRSELEKYEWLKQGMMNDLLTGKVRLV